MILLYYILKICTFSATKTFLWVELTGFPTCCIMMKTALCVEDESSESNWPRLESQPYLYVTDYIT